MIAFLIALAQVVASPPPASPLPAPPPAAASIDGLPIGPLPAQSLPARGCAAYLFSIGNTRALTAMVAADPAALRMTLDGRTIELARTGESGAVALGLSAESVFRTDDVTATVQLTIEPRPNLTEGAAVPSATLRVDRPGRDTVVLPLAGLVGCRA